MQDLEKAIRERAYHLWIESGHEDGNADAHWLVAQDSGKCSGKMSKRQMYVGVADAARMHFHQHLIRSGLRLRNVLDLPRTTDSGNDRSFHNISSYRVSMRENFRSVHDFARE